MQEQEKTEIAKNVLRDLYRKGFIETIYNTENKYFQENGWTLKSGIWSPWYFNLRPVGACPKTVSDIAYVMNHMIRDNVPNLTQIVGIEMAGVPLVSAIATTHGPGCEFIKYSYTRPLPGEKLTNPDQVKEKLAQMKVDFGYGGKELVEGRFEPGENLCILDDMVTNFGSKLITKYILEYELERRKVENVNVDHVAVVLDREQGAEEAAKEYGMHLHSLIKFKTFGLDWLKDIMISQEYNLLVDYQKDPKRYGPELKQKVLEEAAKYRGRK